MSVVLYPPPPSWVPGPLGVTMSHNPPYFKTLFCTKNLTGHSPRVVRPAVPRSATSSPAPAVTTKEPTCLGSQEELLVTTLACHLSYVCLPWWMCPTELPYWTTDFRGQDPWASQMSLEPQRCWLSASLATVWHCHAPTFLSCPAQSHVSSGKFFTLASSPSCVSLLSS